ncbi:hypothetical protein CLV99_0490 [Sphingobacterium yanglingense]|uniref:Uncharacterized protein n=1 Tax=Sphingobacterium yanglingense TaxID=1437280 RepID=A0A4V3DDZ3_9SPHI|nr:hypothetical protein CLV99_0490 [Sphingobacterium yanglingense]
MLLVIRLIFIEVWSLAFLNLQNYATTLRNISICTFNFYFKNSRIIWTAGLVSYWRDGL